MQVAERVASKEQFLDAHRKALRQDLTARLTGKGNDLLPFETLLHLLKTYQQIPHPDLQMIPLERIVGSVGRYKDFTRSFLPRNLALLDRWARIARQANSLEGLPPIDVFKVGDVYFVADGNHRVSVARANGFDFIEANVTEYPIDPGLQPGDSLDQAIIKAGKARFLAETRLDEQIEKPDLYLTRPGGYRHLMEHVEMHRRQMMEERPGTAVSFPEAAFHWYNRSYVPIIEAIRERGLLERFGGRTASDLYIWVWNALLEIQRTFGEPIDPEEGVALLELRAPTAFQRSVQELLGRISNAARGLSGAPETEIPDWVTHTIEWGDAERPSAQEGE
jgi:hypothetical protein